MNADVARESNAGEQTRQKILDAAEALIIEHGFAETSLRAIAEKADVNLAATHYHFGSKQGLLAAVFHRRLEPVKEARLAALTRLEQNNEHLKVADILRAFFVPFYDADDSDLMDILPGLISRIYAEPPAISRPMLQEEFSEVISRFVAALGKACPGIPPNEMNWRFHFMIGSMLQLARFQIPIGQTSEAGSLKEGLDRLVAFTAAGIEQGDSR